MITFWIDDTCVCIKYFATSNRENARPIADNNLSDKTKQQKGVAHGAVSCEADFC